MTEAQRKCLHLRYKFMTHSCIDIFIAKRSMISLREWLWRTESKISGPNFEEQQY